jgi:hypothetical protein
MAKCHPLFLFPPLLFYGTFTSALPTPDNPCSDMVFTHCGHKEPVFTGNGIERRKNEEQGELK